MLPKHRNLIKLCNTEGGNKEQGDVILLISTLQVF